MSNLGCFRCISNFSKQPVLDYCIWVVFSEELVVFCKLQYLRDCRPTLQWAYRWRELRTYEGEKDIYQIHKPHLPVFGISPLTSGLFFPHCLL